MFYTRVYYQQLSIDHQVSFYANNYFEILPIYSIVSTAFKGKNDLTWFFKLRELRIDLNKFDVETIATNISN